jgi:hypothetical protein
MTLGSFTAASGRTLSLAYDDVDPDDPVADIQTAYQNTTDSLVIPELTLPTDEDNFRGIIVACNATGQVMTAPDGYKLVDSHGSSPRVYVFESEEVIAAMPETTVPLAAAAQCCGVGLALRLVGSKPA